MSCSFVISAFIKQKPQGLESWGFIEFSSTTLRFYISPAHDYYHV
jgi:hypothetical protein